MFIMGISIYDLCLTVYICAKINGTVESQTVRWSNYEIEVVLKQPTDPFLSLDKLDCNGQPVFS